MIKMKKTTKGIMIIVALLLIAIPVFAAKIKVGNTEIDVEDKEKDKADKLINDSGKNIDRIALELLVEKLTKEVDYEINSDLQLTCYEFIGKATREQKIQETLNMKNILESK